MLDLIDNKSILIVEDDDALRDRLAIAMQKRGFEARTAASVAEGLAAIEQDVPGFAIIDLRLLDGSGLDVVRSLEKHAPEARAIILTGYGDIPTAVAAARIGAVDYIAKPATADEIVDVLRAPKDRVPPAPVNPISPNEARIEHIEHVFHEAGDNVSHAARLLNMHRRTLQRILKRNGVAADAKQ
jgi:two-component system response regulator RegA